ncbi:MAG: hypothetical protein RLZZ446_684, partial [Bacteroidota bacterium]
SKKVPLWGMPQGLNINTITDAKGKNQF